MWPWPWPAGEMDAAQVQVVAAALAPDRKAAGGARIEPGKPTRPGQIPMRPMPRLPRSVLEDISKKVTD